MIEEPNQRKRITAGDLQARTRRNEFAALLKRAELDPSKFVVQDTEIINMQSGDCEGDWFEFQDIYSSHWPVARIDPWTGTRRAHATGSAEEAFQQLNRWTETIREQKSTAEEFAATPELLPALIAEMEATRAASSLSESEELMDNSLFLAHERTQIMQRLGELEAHVREQSTLNAAQSARLSGQIGYLIESSERLGRKDWLNIMFSVVVAFVMSGIYAPERANELIQYAMGLFQFLGNI